MINIRIKNPNDDKEFEKKLKLFTKLVNNSGVLQEVKERKFFKKPSDIAREKRSKMKRIRENIKRNNKKGK